MVIAWPCPSTAMRGPHPQRWLAIPIGVVGSAHSDSRQGRRRIAGMLWSRARAQDASRLQNSRQNRQRAFLLDAKPFWVLREYRDTAEEHQQTGYLEQH